MIKKINLNETVMNDRLDRLEVVRIKLMHAKEGIEGCTDQMVVLSMLISNLEERVQTCGINWSSFTKEVSFIEAELSACV